MRTALRWMVVAVGVVHGLIHLFGAVKGFGWADVDRLDGPISTTMGVVWFFTAVVVIVAVGLLAAGARRWWIAVAGVAVASQMVIATSWADAKAGTFANLILLVAAVYGFAAHGPRGVRAEYHRRTTAALARPSEGDVLTEADLVRLPEPVAAYVRHTGAVGQPRVLRFRAAIHGRIRAGADKPWMAFTGEQVNTYGADPSRLFLIDATMFGLPIDVFHAYVGSHATMRVKPCSIFTMVDATGPEMDRSETVTVFNDMCILAPAALIDGSITWKVVDDRRARATFTNGRYAINAELVFNDRHELIDFVSDDRSRSLANGTSFRPERWSTPISEYRTIGGRSLATFGEARTHAPDPEGEFTYLEFHLDDIAYNPSPPMTNTPKLPPRWFIRLFWTVHRGLFRLTGGRFGLRRPKPGGYGLLCLETIGRRTGQERRVMLGYFEDGSNFVTMAMNGWGEAEPAWWLNLQARPGVQMHLVDRSLAVIGRRAEGEERERLWARWGQIDENLDGYAARRPAQTAVVVLEPASPSASSSSARSPRNVEADRHPG